MFVIELVCGEDHPKELGKPQYKELSKTIGLLLRMLSSVFNTGRYLVLDSGFCVLKGLIELRRNGLSGVALIKKRR